MHIASVYYWQKGRNQWCNNMRSGDGFIQNLYVSRWVTSWKGVKVGLKGLIWKHVWEKGSQKADTIITMCPKIQLYVCHLRSLVIAIQENFKYIWHYIPLVDDMFFIKIILYTLGCSVISAVPYKPQGMVPKWGVWM